jgi:replicative DNA helicase
VTGAAAPQAPPHMRVDEREPTVATDTTGASAQTQPQNLEAEMSVLGAMLINPNAIPVAGELLAADDFYRTSHGVIFHSITALYEKGVEVDVITVGAELERQGELERAGGRDYLHTLAEFVPAAANALQYAEIVREQSVLRALIRVGNEIADLGYRPSGDTPDLLDRCEQKVFAISQSRRTAEFQHIRDIVATNFERIQAMQRDREISGLATGFTDVDGILGGLQPGNLIVIAARPGMGKTSLALNFAHNIAVDGKAPVAVFSLEMSAQELGDRMMCSQARVSSHKLRTPKLLGDADVSKLVAAAEKLSEAELFIDDSAGLNMFELRAKARRLVSHTPRLSLIIVDYLQLMVGDRRAENRQQEVANISRSLKQLARELSLPVIAVSQLNRAPETRGSGRPQLSDLRESGAIEQDADVVMFIHTDPKDETKKGTIELTVAKHRNGPTGSVRLGFVSDYTKFRTLARSEGYEAG